MDSMCPSPRSALLLALALVGCSGDDSGSDSATATASATASVSASASASASATAGTDSDSNTGTDSDSDSTATTTESATTGTTAVTSDASTTGDETTGDTTDATTMGTTGDTTGDTTSNTTGDTTGVEKEPIPVHEIPGLVSITFWERSGGNAPTAYTFEVLGPELTVALPDPLSDQSHDIKGVTTEFYDVYYSDIDGVFDLNGSYLTIAGAFGQALPAGGGLNLAEISLQYGNDEVEYGSFVASFQALGDNAVPDSAPKAIDGDLQTHTTMGNNVMDPDKRLRVTLGFESSLMPQ